MGGWQHVARDRVLPLPLCCAAAAASGPKLRSYLVVWIFLQPTGCFWRCRVQPHSGTDKSKCKARCKETQASPTGCGQKPVLSGPDQGRSHAGALCVPLKKWKEHGDCTCLNSGLGPRISRRTETHSPTLLEWTGCHTVSLEHLESGQVDVA